MPRDIVLCVDDEPIVLRGCSVALTQAGFRVAVAENGAAGLDTFLELRDEICLVLSDIVMPAVDGLQMAEAILQIAPGTKILLMTGYGDSAILHSRDRFELIRKPFIHSVLIDRVRSLAGDNGTAAASR